MKKRCLDAKFAYHLISSLKRMRKTDGSPFITNGVTLPFLAYAYKKLNKDNSVVSVEYMNDILNALQDADEDYFVFEMCSVINERVIALYSEENNNYYIAAGYYNTPKSHLWCDPKAHDPLQFQKDICALYKDVVEERHYSRTYIDFHYCWSKISDEEEIAIQTIIDKTSNDYIWYSSSEENLVQTVCEAKNAYELIEYFFDEFVGVNEYSHSAFVATMPVGQQNNRNQIFNHRDLFELYPMPLLNDEQYVFIEVYMKLSGKKLKYPFPTALCEHPNKAKQRIFLECYSAVESAVEYYVNDPMIVINKAMEELSHHKEDSPYLYRKMAAMYYRARGAVAWYNYLDKKIVEY